jgi:hypothetical protein
MNLPKGDLVDGRTVQANRLRKAPVYEELRRWQALGTQTTAV